MSEGFAERVAAFKKDYDRVSEEGPEYPMNTPIIVRLTDAILDVTGTGKDIIKEKWVILEGEFQGVTIPLQTFPLSSDFGIRNYKIWAHMLGDFENPPIEDMEEIVAAISNASPVVKMQLRKSGNFLNYDLIERVDASEVAPAAPKTSITRKPAVTQEEPAAEESDDGVEVDIGTTIQFDLEGTEITASVTAVSDDGEKLTAEFEDGGEMVEVADIPIEDVTVVDVVVPEETPAESGVSEILAALAEAQDVEVASDDTDVTVGAKLGGFIWESKELTADEVAALEAVGVEVTKPKPVAKKKAKAKVKAKAKKKVKKKAKRK